MVIAAVLNISRKADVSLDLRIAVNIQLSPRTRRPDADIAAACDSHSVRTGSIESYSVVGGEAYKRVCVATVPYIIVYV